MKPSFYQSLGEFTTEPVITEHHVVWASHPIISVDEGFERNYQNYQKLGYPFGKSRRGLKKFIKNQAN